jgi:hypothetical protein
MPNIKEGAYGLTLLCPIKNGNCSGQSYAALTRQLLQQLELHTHSPLAKVPNTFFARFYILNDVFYEGSPAEEDHLKSHYLVFTSNFHGSLDDYLQGFWREASVEAKLIWQHCVAFDDVSDGASFMAYIKKCQLKTTFYFNGSTGKPLAEQLKALYLKQMLSEFAIENQGASPEVLLQAFRAFVEKTQPFNNDGPTWLPGQNTLDV